MLERVLISRVCKGQNTVKAQQTDPLMDTMDVSNQRGRSRQKKEQRKKPLPIRVSVDTRIKQLRAVAAKWLGKRIKHTLQRPNIHQIAIHLS